MQQQPDSAPSSVNMAQSNYSNSPALMGGSNGGQLALNSNNKSTNSKDASNGALSKSNRPPKPSAGNGNGGGVGGFGGGGRRRKGGSQRYQQRHLSSFNNEHYAGAAGEDESKFQHQGGGFNKTTTSDQRRHQQQPFYQPAAAAAITKVDEFEAGSVFHRGSKKENLNHLLNFQFEPRGNRHHHRLHPGESAGGQRRFNNRGGGKNKKGLDVAPRSKYNKEQYLQANCQFAVRSGPDYSAHLTDPDLIVDWELIEQVVLKTTAKVPSCPICLSPPVAAKITRCGHVYCWTCMLHYLSLSDDEHRKCPICFEEVSNKDLKSVVSVPWREFKIGEEIELTLMRRERNSLFAMPVQDYFAEVNGKHPNIGQANGHSHLVTADPQQVSKMILSREQQELLVLLQEMRDDPTVCYVQQALNLLAERESNLALHAINIDQVRPDIPEGANIEKEPIKDEHVESIVDDANDIAEAQNEAADLSFTRPRHESSSSDGSTEFIEDEDEDGTTVTAKDLDFSATEKVTLMPAAAAAATAVIGGAKSKLVAAPINKAAAPKETFYFYQSSDKQPIFLHAMNVEMLIAEHGSFEKCPLKIRGKILEKDSASMTFDLRDKLRYLSHVPVTCAFEVVELDIKGLVSKEVISKFGSQLEARRLKRSKRARDERRREKRIQVEESKLMGKYRSKGKNLKLESDMHFPGISVTEDQNVEQVIEGVEGRRISESSGFSVDSGGPQSQDTAATTPGGASSFAKMLRQGSSGKPQQPSRMTRSETFPVHAAVAGLTLQQPSRPRQTSESEPEDYVPPPPTQSIGDALASALQRASIAEDPTEATPSGGNSNGGSSSGGKKKGKKAKGKKIDLFCSARPML